MPKDHASTASILLHGAALLGLAATSWLHVGELAAPALASQFFSVILPPPPPGLPPPPPAGGRGAVEEARHPRAEEPAPAEETPPDPVQPEEIAGEIPAPQQEEGTDAETGEASGPGEPGGDPNGVRGGVPGGDPSGVLNGSRDGVPWGLATDGVPGLPAGDEPIYLTGEIRPPERIEFVKPEYPEIARRSRTPGKVILEVVVGRSGEIEAVKVLRSAPLFDDAAIAAVRRWRYQPALQNGRPVKVYLTVVIEFDLR